MSYTQFPIDELSPMVEARAWKELMPSLTSSGIIHPVVVVVVTKEQWKEEQAKYPIMLDPPDKDTIHQIRCGHNRVRCYKELGYSSIPVVIFDSVGAAVLLCKHQELWYRQKHGALV